MLTNISLSNIPVQQEDGQAIHMANYGCVNVLSQPANDKKGARILICD
jgi:hypothetical protein